MSELRREDGEEGLRRREDGRVGLTNTERLREILKRSIARKCEPYRHDPLVRYLWQIFGAVPVLPINHELEVFTVLERKGDGFYFAGSLQDLCEPGPNKAKLEAMLADKGSQLVEAGVELGSRWTAVRKEVNWFTKLVVADTGGWAGSSHLHAWYIRVPNHRVVSATLPNFQKVMDIFSLDMRNSRFRGRGSSPVELYVVRQVVTVPMVEVYALDEDGVSIGAALPPVLTMLPLDASVQEGVANRACYRIQGPGNRPLPMAFRGWKCFFKSGQLVRQSDTRHTTDGVADVEQSPVQQAQELAEQQSVKEWEDDPHRDPDMGDFVEGNKWFVSIKQGE